jgi:endonuclease VIII
VPEGDTIRKLAARINERFAGQPVERCVTRDPRLVGVDLVGTILIGADAVGKHLLVRFDDGRTVHIHLRMDGAVIVGPAARRPEWQRRLELWLPAGRLTAVDVPVLEVIATSAEADVVGHLGPDLCGPEPPDVEEVVARLTDAAAVPIAGALLDQRNVAGFGNVYAVELPFLVGVSPNQPIGSITGLDGLVALGTALIRTNTARGPRNTTGRRLHAPDHWIYGRRPNDRRRPCPVCATLLAGWSAGDSPWRRTAVWCPRCQALELTRAVDLVRAQRLLALHPARRDPSFPVSAARREPPDRRVARSSG